MHTMGPYVRRTRTEREAVARLGQFRTDLQPEEVTGDTAVNGAYGRVVAVGCGASLAPCGAVVEALVRGDDVASAVNQGCSTLYENQQA